MCEQRSEEWFRQRIGKITGSRVSSVLEVNPFKSRTELLYEMVREARGLPPEFTGNEATQWGEQHEKDALQYYQRQTCSKIEEHGFIQHPSVGFLGYSPDAIATTRGNCSIQRYLVEAKCPYSQRIPLEVPLHYRAQVQLGMEVTGTEAAHVVYWTPDQQEIFTIYRDNDWLLKHRAALEEFNRDFRKQLEII